MARLKPTPRWPYKLKRLWTEADLIVARERNKRLKKEQEEKYSNASTPQRRRPGRNSCS